MSTLHAFVELLAEITNSLDNKKCFLKKAFATVDHQLLCKKLEYYGIHGIAYNQYISIDGSDQEGIQCEVPQGSILGPELFDMCNVSK